MAEPIERITLGYIKEMKPFNYCPFCGSMDIFFDDIKKFHCKKCAFTFYHNVAAAVAVILQYEDKVILIRRSEEPCKGKLDLPGGFVDPKETVEDAGKREIEEELGIGVNNLRYLGSYPNIYEYKGVPYNTCDIFFYSEIDTLPTNFDKTEIEELVLINPLEVPDEEIAFESTKVGLRLFARSV